MQPLRLWMNGRPYDNLPNPRSQHPSLAETLLYFATVIQGIDLQPFARHVM
jgi:hypothetical protein